MNRRWLPAAIAVVIMAVVAAAVAGWWFLAGPGKEPDWARSAEVNLLAPSGDAFAADATWVRLELAPARPGVANTVKVTLGAASGTPVPGTENVQLASLTAQPLPGDPASAAPIALTSAPDGVSTGTASFATPGWWRIIATVSAGAARANTEFYLLLPDPNVNGPGAPPKLASSAAGEDLFARGSAAIAALQSVQYTQLMADGIGNAGFSEHAVRTGGDGVPPAFTYRAAGGMDAVVIGSTRWIRLPDDPVWDEQDGAIVVPPAEWIAEYDGATGFTILGEETIDGEPCQLLAFVIPELTEPRQQSMAWYLWWIGKDTGHLRQEAMVSRQHYMLNHFFGFDAPLDIVPPVNPATPTTATPTP